MVSGRAVAIFHEEHLGRFRRLKVELFADSGFVVLIDRLSDLDVDVPNDWP